VAGGLGEIVESMSGGTGFLKPVSEKTCRLIGRNDEKHGFQEIRGARPGFGDFGGVASRGWFLSDTMGMMIL
jgi:hypothetical protein